MGDRRFPGPYRTHLAGRLIAHGDHKVHLRSIGAGEFIPTLGTQILRGMIETLQQLDSIWVYHTCRVATGTIAAVTTLADAIQDRLGKNTATRVAGT